MVLFSLLISWAVKLFMDLLFKVLALAAVYFLRSVVGVLRTAAVAAAESTSRQYSVLSCVG